MHFKMYVVFSYVSLYKVPYEQKYVNVVCVNMNNYLHIIDVCIKKDFTTTIRKENY